MAGYRARIIQALIFAFVLYGHPAHAGCRVYFDAFSMQLGSLAHNLVARLHAWGGGTSDDVARLVRKLQRLPRRDLTRFPEAREYLRGHKVFMSVSTSPKRISFLHHVLATLDLENVERVFVALPERFSRDPSPYVIPLELQNFPKTEILWTTTDLGPATKLIPAAEYVRKHWPGALIITIDDDTGYPIGMINEFIHAAAYTTRGAFSGSGRLLTSWDLPAPSSSEYAAVSPNVPDLQKIRESDVLEGFAGVAYRADELDTGLIRDWIGRCKECLLSDDMLISMALRKAGMPRYHISSNFYALRMIRQFSFGFRSDALHKGANGVIPGRAPSFNANTANFQAAFRTIEPEIRP